MTIKEEKYGLAIDIGTTNVCVALVKGDGHNNVIVDKKSIINSQTEFGRDIITRITWYDASINRLATLNTIVLNDINKLIGELVKLIPDGVEISDVVVSGNTIMSYFFTFSKYRPNYGLDVPTNAQVFVVPNIGGYVGGDVLSGLYYLDVLKKNQDALLVDIGTNGEVCLFNQGKLLATSAAAGPAFEGMFDTIKGSEIVDILAKLLNKGFIDGTGVLLSADEARAINPVDEDIKLMDTNEDDVNTYFYNDVYISQDHVRGVQLATGAIKAAIKILLNNADLKFEDLKNVYIAGAFGSNLDIDNGKTVGIIPPVSNETIVLSDNTSLLGNAKLLFKEDKEGEVKDILGVSTHVELAKDESFQDVFINSINFK